MKLTELYIKGFGKWSDANFRFAPGINLFHAPNEAGKSTLLQAIFASLYGMKRDYVRVTRYLDEYEQYVPWDHSAYETIVRYQLHDRAFRLHRRLDKEREAAKLYLEPELLEINRQYKEDKRKEFDFLERHLGLNRTLFTDLTWVRQHELAAGRALIPSVSAREQTDAAAQKLLSGIEADIALIGRKETAENTLLGKAAKLLRQKQEEMAKAEEAWRSVQHLTHDISAWQTELLGLTREHGLVVERQKQLEAREADWHYWFQRSYETKQADQLLAWQEAAATAEERELHRRTREQILAIGQSGNERDVGQGANLPGSDGEIERLQADYQAGMTARKQLEELQQRQDELGSLLAAEANRTRLGQRERMLQELKDGWPQLELFDPALALQARSYLELQTSRFASQISRQARRATQRTRKQNSGAFWLAVTAGVSLLVGAGSLAAGFSFWGGLALLLAVLTGGVVGTLQYRGRIRQSAQNQTEDWSDVRSWLDLVRVSSLEKLEEFALAYDTWQQVISSGQALEQATDDALLANGHYRSLKAEREQCEQEITERQKQLEEIAAEWQQADWDAFLAMREGKIGQALQQSEQEKQQQRINQLLKVWEEQVRELAQEEKRRLEEQRAAYSDNRRQLEERILLMREKIAQARGVIGRNDQLSWARAKSECEAAAAEVNKLLVRREALELARTTLQEAMTELQRENSPDVNRLASEIMDALTEGKYCDIRLDPTHNFSVRVLDSRWQSVLPLDRLSAGTQNQLYFAQRIALLRYVSAEREPLPVFFDDHFINYDEERLQRALDYLIGLAEEHQIFLFTCQQREKNYLQSHLAGSDRHAIHDWNQ